MSPVVQDLGRGIRAVIYGPDIEFGHRISDSEQTYLQARVAYFYSQACDCPIGVFVRHRSLIERKAYYHITEDPFYEPRLQLPDSVIALLSLDEKEYAAMSRALIPTAPGGVQLPFKYNRPMVRHVYDQGTSSAQPLPMTSDEGWRINRNDPERRRTLLNQAYRQAGGEFQRSSATPILDPKENGRRYGPVGEDYESRQRRLMAQAAGQTLQRDQAVQHGKAQSDGTTGHHVLQRHDSVLSSQEDMHGLLLATPASPRITGLRRFPRNANRVS